MAAMSSTPKNTRDAILDYALDAINRRGVEAVGMREVARGLELSPGNLTYHFPTKEDLLFGLSARLGELNERTEVLGGMPTNLVELLERFRAVFQNHVAFRGLLLALVHVHDQYPRIREGYEAHQKRRTATFGAMLRGLRDRGSLAQATHDRDIARLAGFCTLIGRFWISEAHLDGRDPAHPSTQARYLDLLAAAIAPHATPRGHEELARFRSSF